MIVWFSKVSERALSGLTRTLNTLYDLAITHPRVTVGFVIALTLSGAFGLPKVKTLISFRDMYDRGSPALTNYDEVESLFHTGNPVLLIAKPRGQIGWTEQTLCQLKRWVSRQYLENPEISRLSSPFDLREVKSTATQYYYQRTLNLNCDAPKTQPDPETDRKILAVLGSPWKGILIDPEGRDLAVEISFRDTPVQTRFGRFDPRPIGEVMKSFEADLGKSFEAHWSGPAMYDYSISQGMKRAPLMNLAVLLLIFLLYRRFVGTWKSGALFGGTLILTGITIFGWMGYTGTPIDFLSSMIFLLVTVAAHQDFSFLSSQRMTAKATDFRDSFRQFLVPSFCTSITSMIGFGSLCISDLSILNRFGLWAALGAGLEWCMVMLFLPALLSLFPRFQNWTDAKKSWRVPGGDGHSKKVSSWVRISSWVLMAIMLSTPWAVMNANVSDNPRAVFPSDHPFSSALDYLRDSRGWDGSLSLVFSAQVPENRQHEILSELKKDPLVHRVENLQSVTGFLKEGLSERDTSLLERDLTGSAIFKRYQAKDGRTRALLYLNDSDLIKYRSLKASVLRLCEGGLCFIAGPLDVYTEYTYVISRTLPLHLVVSLVLILIVMQMLIWALKTPHGWALIATSFWGPLIMLSVLTFFQVPLNVYTCNFGTILVGLTGDNAIQFMFAGKKGTLEDGVAGSRDGAIFTSVVMALCSLTFLLSAFQPPRTVGLLLFSGFLLCLFGDYWILRGILPASLPRSRAPLKS